MSTKLYDEQQKYQLECQKIDKEIEALKKPIYRQTGLMVAILPLLLSIGLNLQQCNSRKSEKESIELDIKRDRWVKDSIKVDIKKNQMVLDSIKVDATATAKLLADQKDTLNTLEREIAAIKQTPNLPASAQVSLSNIKQSVSNLSQATKYASVNLGTPGLSFRVSSIKNDELAAAKEREGFYALMNNDYNDAAIAFTQSENASNGYHHVYELARLLRKKASSMGNSDIRKSVLTEVYNEKYTNNAPPLVLEWLKTEINK